MFKYLLPVQIDNINLKFKKNWYTYITLSVKEYKNRECETFTRTFPAVQMIWS
jgi:hypothetical protein